MKAIYAKQMPVALVKGKWTYKTEEYEVRVMVEIDGFAMVRRKGCYPFVVKRSDLRAVGKPGESA